MRVEIVTRCLFAYNEHILVEFFYDFDNLEEDIFGYQTLAFTISKRNSG